MKSDERPGTFQRRLQEMEIDVAFLIKPHNVFYFAGWAPVCSGIVFMADAAPAFFTLWLDAPEGKRVCRMPIVSYVYPREDLVGKMIQFARKRNESPRRIGVEKDHLLARDYEKLKGAFCSADLIDISPEVDRLRSIKSDQEISCLRKSAEIAVRAMDAALRRVSPGVSEMEIAAEAQYVMTRSGSQRPAFGPFVASGPRTLLAHPYPSTRLIEPGDPVVIDLGATWNGYASDICRTAFAGDPPKEKARYLRLVVEAQQAAASALKEGSLSCEVYQAAFEVFDKEGLGKLLPYDIGYGVGLRHSEFYPVIEKGNKTALKQNMVVTLLHTSPFSKELGGLRVEDTFLIKSDGCEKLTDHVQQLP